ncbi:MFS_1_like domain-containing protein [Caerostris extrusa]|uniref:MFS_1_like domain-containing protein n=1 Tax=Caerostris extrusa TaxID=172846 RepID=A0AAV4WH52_CAEEX|nr:MFS_1_like domain-containing protein [Caerostris extrusa]
MSTSFLLQSRQRNRRRKKILLAHKQRNAEIQDPFLPVQRRSCSSHTLLRLYSPKKGSGLLLLLWVLIHTVRHSLLRKYQKTGAIFGRQRMWGSIGWGTFAPIAGTLNDHTGDFLVSWTVMAVMLLLFLWNISKMELLKPHFSQNILRDVGAVFKSKEFLIFEVMIFMNGVGTGMVWFYLIWFVRSIGGSELLCGLSLAVQSFGGAIPFMFFSGWFIKKVGHFNLLIVALMTYVLRFLFYSYLYSPWWILPMELSHGITFGLYYTVLASYGKMSSKPGVEATTQSVIFSTHEGLGASLGCVFAGIGFDYLECHRTFFFASMFFACGSLVGLMLRFALRRRTAVIKIISVNEQ